MSGSAAADEMKPAWTVRPCIETIRMCRSVLALKQTLDLDAEVLRDVTTLAHTHARLVQHGKDGTEAAEDGAVSTTALPLSTVVDVFAASNFTADEIEQRVQSFFVSAVTYATVPVIGCVARCLHLLPGEEWSTATLQVYQTFMSLFADDAGTGGRIAVPIGSLYPHIVGDEDTTARTATASISNMDSDAPTSAQRPTSAARWRVRAALDRERLRNLGLTAPLMSAADAATYVRNVLSTRAAPALVDALLQQLSSYALVSPIDAAMLPMRRVLPEVTSPATLALLPERPAPHEIQPVFFEAEAVAVAVCKAFHSWESSSLSALSSLLRVVGWADVMDLRSTARARVEAAGNRSEISADGVGDVALATLVAASGGHDAAVAALQLLLRADDDAASLVWSRTLPAVDSLMGALVTPPLPPDCVTIPMLREQYHRISVEVDALRTAMARWLRSALRTLLLCIAYDTRRVGCLDAVTFLGLLANGEAFGFGAVAPLHRSQRDLHHTMFAALDAATLGRTMDVLQAPTEPELPIGTFLWEMHDGIAALLGRMALPPVSGTAALASSRLVSRLFTAHDIHAAELDASALLVAPRVSRGQDTADALHAAASDSWASVILHEDAPRRFNAHATSTIRIDYVGAFVALFSTLHRAHQRWRGLLTMTINALAAVARGSSDGPALVQVSRAALLNDAPALVPSLQIAAGAYGDGNGEVLSSSPYSGPTVQLLQSYVVQDFDCMALSVTAASAVELSVAADAPQRPRSGGGRRVGGHQPRLPVSPRAREGAWRAPSPAERALRPPSAVLRIPSLNPTTQRLQYEQALRLMHAHDAQAARMAVHVIDSAVAAAGTGAHGSGDVIPASAALVHAWTELTRRFRATSPAPHDMQITDASDSVTAPVHPGPRVRSPQRQGATSTGELAVQTSPLAAASRSASPALLRSLPRGTTSLDADVAGAELEPVLSVMPPPTRDDAAHRDHAPPDLARQLHEQYLAALDTMSVQRAQDRALLLQRVASQRSVAMQAARDLGARLQALHELDRQAAAALRQELQAAMEARRAEEADDLSRRVQFFRAAWEEQRSRRPRSTPHARPHHASALEQHSAHATDDARVATAQTTDMSTRARNATSGLLRRAREHAAQYARGRQRVVQNAAIVATQRSVRSQDDRKVVDKQVAPRQGEVHAAHGDVSRPRGPSADAAPSQHRRFSTQFAQKLTVVHQGARRASEHGMASLEGAIAAFQSLPDAKDGAYDYLESSIDNRGLDLRHHYQSRPLQHSAPFYAVASAAAAPAASTPAHALGDDSAIESTARHVARENASAAAALFDLLAPSTRARGPRGVVATKSSSDGYFSKPDPVDALTVTRSTSSQKLRSRTRYNTLALAEPVVSSQVSVEQAPDTVASPTRAVQQVRAATSPMRGRDPTVKTRLRVVSAVRDARATAAEKDAGYLVTNALPPSKVRTAPALNSSHVSPVRGLIGQLPLPDAPKQPSTATASLEEAAGTAEILAAFGDSEAVTLEAAGGEFIELSDTDRGEAQRAASSKRAQSEQAIRHQALPWRARTPQAEQREGADIVKRVRSTSPTPTGVRSKSAASPSSPSAGAFRPPSAVRATSSPAFSRTAPRQRHEQETPRLPTWLSETWSSRMASSRAEIDRTPSRKAPSRGRPMSVPLIINDLGEPMMHGGTASQRIAAVPTHAHTTADPQDGRTANTMTASSSQNTLPRPVTHAAAERNARQLFGRPESRAASPVDSAASWENTQQAVVAVLQAPGPSMPRATADASVRAVQAPLMPVITPAPGVIDTNAPGISSVTTQEQDATATFQRRVDAAWSSIQQTMQQLLKPTAPPRVAADDSKLDEMLAFAPSVRRLSAPSPSDAAAIAQQARRASSQPRRASVSQQQHVPDLAGLALGPVPDGSTASGGPSAETQQRRASQAEAVVEGLHARGRRRASMEAVQRGDKSPIATPGDVPVSVTVGSRRLVGLPPTEAARRKRGSSIFSPPARAPPPPPPLAWKFKSAPPPPPRMLIDAHVGIDNVERDVAAPELQLHAVDDHPGPDRPSLPSSPTGISSWGDSPGHGGGRLPSRAFRDSLLLRRPSAEGAVQAHAYDAESADARSDSQGGSRASRSRRARSSVGGSGDAADASASETAPRSSASAGGVKPRTPVRPRTQQGVMRADVEVADEATVTTTSQTDSGSVQDGEMSGEHMGDVGAAVRSAYREALPVSRQRNRRRRARPRSRARPDEAPSEGEDDASVSGDSKDSWDAGDLPGGSAPGGRSASRGTPSPRVAAATRLATVSLGGEALAGVDGRTTSASGRPRLVPALSLNDAGSGRATTPATGRGGLPHTASVPALFHNTMPTPGERANTSRQGLKRTLTTVYIAAPGQQEVTTRSSSPASDFVGLDTQRGRSTARGDAPTTARGVAVSYIDGPGSQIVTRTDDASAGATTRPEDAALAASTSRSVRPATQGSKWLEQPVATAPAPADGRRARKGRAPPPDREKEIEKQAAVVADAMKAQLDEYVASMLDEEEAPPVPQPTPAAAAPRRASLIAAAATAMPDSDMDDQSADAKKRRGRRRSSQVSGFSGAGADAEPEPSADPVAQRIESLLLSWQKEGADAAAAGEFEDDSFPKLPSRRQMRYDDADDAEYAAIDALVGALEDDRARMRMLMEAAESRRLAALQLIARRTRLVPWYDKTVVELLPRVPVQSTATLPIHRHALVSGNWETAAATARAEEATAVFSPRTEFSAREPQQDRRSSVGPSLTSTFTIDLEWLSAGGAADAAVALIPGMQPRDGLTFYDDWDPLDDEYIATEDVLRREAEEAAQDPIRKRLNVAAVLETDLMHDAAEHTAVVRTYQLPWEQFFDTVLTLVFKGKGLIMDDMKGTTHLAPVAEATTSKRAPAQDDATSPCRAGGRKARPRLSVGVPDALASVNAPTTMLPSSGADAVGGDPNQRVDSIVPPAAPVLLSPAVAELARRLKRANAAHPVGVSFASDSVVRPLARTASRFEPPALHDSAAPAASPPPDAIAQVVRSHSLSESTMSSRQDAPPDTSVEHHLQMAAAAAQLADPSRTRRERLLLQTLLATHPTAIKAVRPHSRVRDCVFFRVDDAWLDALRQRLSTSAGARLAVDTATPVASAVRGSELVEWRYYRVQVPRSVMTASAAGLEPTFSLRVRLAPAGSLTTASETSLQWRFEDDFRNERLQGRSRVETAPVVDAGTASSAGALVELGTLQAHFHNELFGSPHTLPTRVDHVWAARMDTSALAQKYAVTSVAPTSSMLQAHLPAVQADARHKAVTMVIMPRHPAYIHVRAAAAQAHTAKAAEPGDFHTSLNALMRGEQRAGKPGQVTERATTADSIGLAQPLEPDATLAETVAEYFVGVRIVFDGQWEALQPLVEAHLKTLARPRSAFATSRSPSLDVRLDYELVVGCSAPPPATEAEAARALAHPTDAHDDLLGALVRERKDPMKHVDAFIRKFQQLAREFRDEHQREGTLALPLEGRGPVRARGRVQPWQEYVTHSPRPMSGRLDELDAPAAVDAHPRLRIVTSVVERVSATGTVKRTRVRSARREDAPAPSLELPLPASKDVLLGVDPRAVGAAEAGSDRQVVWKVEYEFAPDPLLDRFLHMPRTLSRRLSTPRMSDLGEDEPVGPRRAELDAERPRIALYGDDEQDSAVATEYSSPTRTADIAGERARTADSHYGARRRALPSRQSGGEAARPTHTAQSLRASTASSEPIEPSSPTAAITRCFADVLALHAAEARALLASAVQAASDDGDAQSYDMFVTSGATEEHVAMDSMFQGAHASGKPQTAASAEALPQRRVLAPLRTRAVKLPHHIPNPWEPRPPSLSAIGDAARPPSTETAHAPRVRFKSDVVRKDEAPTGLWAHPVSIPVMTQSRSTSSLGRGELVSTAVAYADIFASAPVTAPSTELVELAAAEAAARKKRMRELKRILRKGQRRAADPVQQLRGSRSASALIAAPRSSSKGKRDGAPSRMVSALASIASEADS